MVKEMSRREFLVRFGLTGLGLGMATIAGTNYYFGPRQDRPNWTNSEEEILRSIEGLAFEPGSELRTSICPRKSSWEENQRLKIEGTWEDQGIDDSDWRGNIKVIQKGVKKLGERGFKGVRLAVFPFEVVNDHDEYDWAPIETMLSMLEGNNLNCDLCVGPLQWPFGPAGVRLPRKYEDLLSEEFKDRSRNRIRISMQDDENMPMASQAIREHALRYLRKILEKFGHDPRVRNINLGNEWPDAQIVENVKGADEDGVLEVGEDLMVEAAEMVVELTDKPIAMNTNIHPYRTRRMKQALGKVFEVMGGRGKLQIDTYPTREDEDPSLRANADEYADGINRVRLEFPQAEIEFGEFQGEPYADGIIAGKSWAEIMKDYDGDVVIPFYQNSFPNTLARIVIGKIKVTGIWGEPLLQIAERMGYDFPMRMMQTITKTMNARN